MDLNFEKMNGLIPAIIQDNSTNKSTDVRVYE